MRAANIRRPAGPAFLLCVVLGVLPLSAQNSARNPDRTQITAPGILPEVRPSSTPQWVQDLRRGEIVAFGSFPFTMFLSTFTMDSIRFFKNDRDRAYLPWPLKGPGAVEMSREEKEQTLLIAVAASLSIAIADFAIVKVKRNREVREQARGRGGDIRLTQSSPGGVTADSEAPSQEEAGDP